MDIAKAWEDTVSEFVACSRVWKVNGLVHKNNKHLGKLIQELQDMLGLLRKYPNRLKYLFIL